MKDYPRVLTVQDISCLGQCSAAVALPILSACGCEAVILPTMVLSTHTGGLGMPSRRDLTEDLTEICDHWKNQGIRFDAIYVGYLGKKEQVQLVLEVLDDLLAPEGLCIVDPAMADHGKLYAGLDEAYAAEMKRLCARADVMLPNLTEAQLLTGCHGETEQLLQKLHSLSGKAVVLTGVAEEENQTGAAIFSGDELVYVSHDKQPGSYHGTGDMFASVLAGKLARGESLETAAKMAGEFVCAAIASTRENPAHAYGVKFETALPLLWK